MKALVWKGGQHFEVESVPDPKVEPGRLVIRVEACAICGSDLHLAEFGDEPPLIPGHEVAGTVAEIGDGVSGFSVGDRVALNPVQHCGTCWCCMHGVEHLCTNFRHLGCFGVDGAWAEYVLIDADNAYPIPQGADFASAAIVEPCAVCYQSFQRSGIHPGDSVLVIGDGPFGFLHAQIARVLGAGKIVVAGHYDRRLERISAQTDAIGCNTHHVDLAGVIEKEIDYPGVDIVIEATGAGPSPDLGIKALRPRGTLILFSYIWNPQSYEMGLIHMNELNVLGACRSLDGYEPCLQLIGEGKLNTAALVDVQAPLEDSQRVMERLKEEKGKVFKAIFLPRE